MSAHLKQTQSDRFFTVVGSPNTSVIPIDGKFKVIMSGLNTYNPINNTVESTLAEDVVAWFIDRDYNGRTFCPRYSFFPKIETWRNIAKSFKTMINEDLWEVFTGTESPLFSAGKHKCIAVKVIDRHGHELMSVHALGDLNE